MAYKVGQKIHIIKLHNPGSVYGDKIDEGYSGKEGEITLIDDIGQLHGTWGGVAVIPGTDEFVLSLDNFSVDRLASVAYNGIVGLEEQGMSHDEVLSYLGISEEEYNSIVHGGRSL